MMCIFEGMEEQDSKDLVTTAGDRGCLAFSFCLRQCSTSLPPGCILGSKQLPDSTTQIEQTRVCGLERTASGLPPCLQVLEGGRLCGDPLFHK